MRFFNLGEFKVKSFNDVFAAAKEYCKEHMTDTAAKIWIEPLSFVAFDDDTVYVDCTETVLKQIAETRYKNLWTDAFKEIFGSDLKIVFLDENESTIYIEQNKEEKKFSLEKNTEKETFDNFIVGPSNKFAYAAACAVAKRPAESSKNNLSYNPLLIYGNSGLGKTHLMNAICYEIRKKNSSANIIFVHAEDFTNEFIYHISNRTSAIFHEKYRNADVLLIDDIQFLAGKTQTQEEFFHTINSYIMEDKQIILTSDRPPRDIQTLEERIRTRLEGGLLADIQPPEFETRIAIIKNKLKSFGIEISEDIINYIAERVKNDVRQLEGVVKRLNAYYDISGEPPTLAQVKETINNITTNSQPVSQIVEKIIMEVSRMYHVSVDDIFSTRRISNISNARQISMYIIRQITDLSLEQIGEKFSKHYSTVIHSIEQVEERQKTDSTLKAQINDIIKNVKD